MLIQIVFLSQPDKSRPKIDSRSTRALYDLISKALKTKHGWILVAPKNQDTYQKDMEKLKKSLRDRRGLKSIFIHGRTMSLYIDTD